MHSRITLRRHRPVVRRTGFTLIELLIAIVIFTILATIAISAFQQSDQDRAAAAAQTVRSMLEGARSKAIHDGQLRGVRLLLDPTNPRTVTSLAYIGAPRAYEGQITIDQIAATGVWEFTDASGSWANLRNRGLLQAGARIEVPSRSGQFYVITSVLPGPPVRVRVGGHYIQSEWDSSSPPAKFYPRYTLLPVQEETYRLQLAPPLLPGTSPVPLAAGVAIDLVASSNLPTSWYSDNGTDSSAALPVPYWSDDVYSNSMDILFTPRGDITGAAAAQGLMHLYIADLEDIAIADISNAARVAPWMVPLQVEKAERLVSLFTRTGFVTATQVNRFGLYGGNPYAFALYGQEAK